MDEQKLKDEIAAATMNAWEALPMSEFSIDANDERQVLLYTEATKEGLQEIGQNYIDNGDHDSADYWYKLSENI